MNVRCIPGTSLSASHVLCMKSHNSLGSRYFLVAPFHRGGAATWKNNPLMAAELIEKQGWQVQRLLGAKAVPLGPGHTEHMCLYTHVGLHQDTHTHKDIHAEECMTVSRPATSALPLTLRGCLRAGWLWAEWGKQSGAPFPLRPLPYNPIKYQDSKWPSRPTPAHL